MTPLTIEIWYGGRPPRVFRLDGPRVTIGSAGEATLVVPLSFVRPVHLEFEHGLLLSRVRTTGPGVGATLDGYPVPAEWTLLPRRGLIEIMNPAGGPAVQIGVSLEPPADVTPPVGVEEHAAHGDPLAAMAAAAARRPTGSPRPAVRVARDEPAEGAGAMHVVPLAIAGVLLAGLIVGLLVIDLSGPKTPAGGAPAPQGPVAAVPPPPWLTPPVAPTTAPVAPATRAVDAKVTPAPAAVGPVAPAVTRFSPYVPPPPSATDREMAAVRAEVVRELGERRATTGPADPDMAAAFERATTAVAGKLAGATSVAFASPETPGGAVVVRRGEGEFVVRGRVTTTNAAGVPLRQLYSCVVRKAGDGGWVVERAAVLMP